MIEAQIKPSQISVSIQSKEVDAGFGYPVIRVQPSEYTGAYNVTPGAENIVLQTDGLMMTDNVEVSAIGLPYADVSAVDAIASDVLQGKIIVDSDGNQVVGTASGSCVLVEKNISENGTYNAEEDNADGYSKVVVSVPQGVIIPVGFAYYNGYLLPKIPVDDEYKYTLIRKNNYTGNYDCIQGKSAWRARTQSTLDNWQLEFANMTTVGTRQYSVPQSGTTTTATDWGEYTVSTASYYGTAQDRKIVWASHDIGIVNSSNVLYRCGPSIE